MTRAEACNRARDLLRAVLRDHPDESVRLLNELAHVPDDHPAVSRIADRLMVSSGTRR